MINNKNVIKILSLIILVYSLFFLIVFFLSPDIQVIKFFLGENNIKTISESLSHNYTSEYSGFSSNLVDTMNEGRIINITIGLIKLIVSFSLIFSSLFFLVKYPEKKNKLLKDTIIFYTAALILIFIPVLLLFLVNVLFSNDTSSGFIYLIYEPFFGFLSWIMFLIGSILFFLGIKNLNICKKNENLL